MTLVTAGGFTPVFLLLGYLLYRKSVLGKAKTAFEARYFLFEKVSIQIQSEYHYLFNKCQESLRSIGWKIIDADEDKGTIEAYYQPSAIQQLFQRKTILIAITLESISRLKSLYNIKYELSELPSDQKLKISNHFVDRLVSKPKNASDQAQSKEK